MGRNVRKRTFEQERPAKILTSLRIRAVWSESSVGAFWIAKDAKCLYADNEDSDKTASSLGAHGRRRLLTLRFMFVYQYLPDIKYFTL